MDRTGDVGNCVEFDRKGRMLAGTDQLTIHQMVRYSARWPDTMHRYQDNRGLTVWAQAGKEIAPPTFDQTT